MAEMPRRSRRVVGLALFASAGVLLLMALLVYTGLLPLDAGIRNTVAAVFGAVALVDLVIGFWFFRASLSS